MAYRRLSDVHADTDLAVVTRSGPLPPVLEAVRATVVHEVAHEE